MTEDQDPKPNDLLLTLATTCIAPLIWLDVHFQSIKFVQIAAVIENKECDI